MKLIKHSRGRCDTGVPTKLSRPVDSICGRPLSWACCTACYFQSHLRPQLCLLHMFSQWTPLFRLPRRHAPNRNDVETCKAPTLTRQYNPLHHARTLHGHYEMYYDAYIFLFTRLFVLMGTCFAKMHYIGCQVLSCQSNDYMSMYHHAFLLITCFSNSFIKKYMTIDVLPSYTPIVYNIAREIPRQVDRLLLYCGWKKVPYRQVLYEYYWWYSGSL